MDSREILSFAADIFTIVGISLVGFIGTPYLSNILGNKFSLFDVLNGTFFIFILIILFIFICIKLFYSAKPLLRKEFSVQSIGKFLFSFFLLCLAVGITPYFFNFWASLFNNQYLFPQKPSSIVETLDDFGMIDDHPVSGKIILKTDKKGVDQTDYCVVLYSRYNDDTKYKIRGDFPLDIDNHFLTQVVPLTEIFRKNKLESVIVSVVRKLSLHPFNHVPESITGTTDIELYSVGAYSQEIYSSKSQ